MRDYFNENSKTRFVFPIDGDFINERDGVLEGSAVELFACVSSSPNSRVRINGTFAEERERGKYQAKIRLSVGESELLAENLDDGSTAAVRVFRLADPTYKYRISSDDNILFLADITEKRDVYSSIFDNPYLAVYKKAHDLYGAKVHLNLFYSFDRTAAEHFGTSRPDFDLSCVTDKFKDEWERNSDWLKLSFHARREFPDSPYLNAAPEEIVADFLDVRREVLRFAGEASFSGDVTTVHFGALNPPCAKALRELGHKALAGYFELDEKGEPLVAYYAPIGLTNHVGERDFWRDTEMGITFGRIDLVTNLNSLDWVMSEMQSIVDHPGRGGFVSIMIHEQYFYEDYDNHLPDFEARVLGPAKMLYERGYRASLLKETLGL